MRETRETAAPGPASWAGIPGEFGQKFRLQRGRCIYCESRMIPPMECDARTQALAVFELPPDAPFRRRIRSYRTATREHVTRQADGGLDGDNVVIACHFCNTWRGEIAPLEWKTAMVRLVVEGLHPVRSGAFAEAAVRGALRRYLSSRAPSAPRSDDVMKTA